MLDGFFDEEVDQYLEDNPKLISLSKFGIIEAVRVFVSRRDTEMEENIRELNPKSMDELRHAPKP